MGVDPAMFSQSLMYHAHKYSKDAWAGEPETDPTQDSEPVEGWEQTPLQCLELAYDGVLRAKDVVCGMSRLFSCSTIVCYRYIRFLFVHYLVLSFL